MITSRKGSIRKVFGVLIVAALAFHLGRLYEYVDSLDDKWTVEQFHEIKLNVESLPW